MTGMFTLRPYSIGRRPSSLLTKAEVAASGAFHDRLPPGQFELIVETDDHGVITVAVHAVADVRKPELSVEFGVSAAGHVEVETIVGLAENLNVHGAAACP